MITNENIEQIYSEYIKVAPAFKEAKECLNKAIMLRIIAVRVLRDTPCCMPVHPATIAARAALKQADENQDAAQAAYDDVFKRVHMIHSLYEENEKDHICYIDDIDDDGITVVRQSKGGRPGYGPYEFQSKVYRWPRPLRES